MIKLEYVVQNIIENSINVREQENERKAITVGVEESFYEWFETPLTDKKVEELSAKYTDLEICNESIQAKIIVNFLFINAGYFYYCFDNLDEYKPWFKNESKWKFTTNHDSCWRTNAFDQAKQKIFNIKKDIFEISKIYNLDNINILKHIIPNFSTVYNSDIFEIETWDIKSDKKDIEHKLTQRNDGLKLWNFNVIEK